MRAALCSTYGGPEVIAVTDIDPPRLGAGDDLEKLVHLLVAGRGGITLLDAADEAAQLRNLVCLAPRVKHKQGHQNGQTQRQRTQLGYATEPRDEDETSRQRAKHHHRQKPNISFAPGKLFALRQKRRGFG